jgi:hypothetical protein
MLRLIHSWKRASTNGRTLWVAPAILVMLTVLTWTVGAQETSQRTFSSPQEALTTLVQALQAGDRESLPAILGPESEEIISSGDPVSDKADRERFLAAYAEKADLVRENDRVEVVLGNDNWPFPIPIVKKGDGWLFDTQAGKEEIVNRRIGRNELDTVKICQGYVEAQKEYASADREQDEIIQYAQKILSDPGKRNGLYWEAAEGEVPSPLGPFVARAAAEGYKRGDKPIPFHGYYFRILTAQGSQAPGGAYNYVINGHMVAGFAMVAWPADYGASGVMTFVVNRNGVVHEKDLGPGTAETVRTMRLYNPDQTWRRSQ